MHKNQVLDTLNTLRLKTAISITKKKLVDLKSIICLGSNHDFLNLVRKDEWDFLVGTEK